MTTDIVERLRACANVPTTSKITQDAADEIERLGELISAKDGEIRRRANTVFKLRKEIERLQEGAGEPADE